MATTEELQHVVTTTLEGGPGAGAGEETVGVAEGKISALSNSFAAPKMSINNAVVGDSLFQTTMMTKRKWRLNKKHCFGMVLLMIVDLIWVVSAGLTKYLFKSQDYDKPLFTVYFKTILFSIYLIPFAFWRPWQRLCCSSKSCMKRTSFLMQNNTSDHVINRTSIGQSKYGSINHQPSSQHQRDDLSTSTSVDIDYMNSSSFNHSSSFCDIKESKNTLGPSEFTPIKFNDGNQYLTNSLTVPRKVTESTDRLLTASSSVPLSKHKTNQIRFCQTVEVKTVPDSCSNTEKEEEEMVANSHIAQIVPVRIVVLLALVFGILWFFANYLYAKALENQSVAAVNTLSSLSGVFVLVLAAIPFPRIQEKDKISLTKILVICLSVSGAVMVGLSSSSDKKGGISVGALYAIGGSCLYAFYLVLLNKFIPNSDSLEIPMFFGFVGLLDGILLVPLVVSWNFLGFETFQLPPTSEVWTILLVNGFVGTVLSELLWLWGCLLTSSLVGTLSLSLVSPLSITYSIIISDAKFSTLFFFGASVIVISFVAISIIDHSNGWDPVWLLMKAVWKHMKNQWSDYNTCNTVEEKTFYESTLPDVPIHHTNKP